MSNCKLPGAGAVRGSAFATWPVVAVTTRLHNTTNLMDWWSISFPFFKAK